TGSPLWAVIGAVFVLGGGGGKGACQVGMLRAVIEQGIRADAVVGVSVGALNGAVYAATPDRSAIERLADLWEHLDEGSLFPKRRLGNTWRYAQRAVSVFPEQGLKQLINDHFPLADISDTTIPIHVLCAKYDTGAEVWFDRGKPDEVLYASAAIPGVFPPLVRDGVTLIDGGIVDDAPLSRAIELEATDVYLFLCGTTYGRLSPPNRPLEALMRTAGHAKLARLRSEIAHLPSGVSLTILDCPDAAGIEALDFSRRKDLLKAGYERTMGILNGDIKVEPLSEP
ncbi:MAG: patatin-like phospholipase family protein, partial [Acidimicrobiales bacterium]